MKFMIIVKANKDSENSVLPSADLLSRMMKYNEELVKAGVMLDGAGLQPSSAGARVVFDGNSRRVVDGPFTETKELVAGYWLWQCRSREEAIEWAKRCPSDGDGALEIRPLFEMSDFPHADAETLQLAAKLEERIKGA